MEKCDKKQFTKKEAAEALKRNKKSSKQYRKECRIYHCPDCNMWHLTSKKNEPPSPKIEPLPEFKKYIE